MAIVSKEKAELEELFKNISKGLKEYPAKEFNRAIIAFLNQKGSRTEETHWILDQVCKEHNISRRVLIYSGEYGDVVKARQLACCLLHDLLGFSQRQIAIRILKKTPRIGIAYAGEYVSKPWRFILPPRQKS